MISFGRGLRHLSNFNLDVDGVPAEQRPLELLLKRHLHQGVFKYCLPPMTKLPIAKPMISVDVMEAVAEASLSGSDYVRSDEESDEESDDEDSRTTGGNEKNDKRSPGGRKKDVGRGDGAEKVSISSAKWMESGVGKCAFESYLAEAFGTSSGALVVVDNNCAM